MRRILFALGFAALMTLAASAQTVPDHLKCYKVKDPQAKTTYTADLGGLVAEPGCKIKVPAIMACVPAIKTNVNPTPPGTGGSGTPNPFGCYKVKCPKATLPAIALLRVRRKSLPPESAPGATGTGVAFDDTGVPIWPAMVK